MFILKSQPLTELRKSQRGVHRVLLYAHIQHHRVLVYLMGHVSWFMVFLGVMYAATIPYGFFMPESALKSAMPTLPASSINDVNVYRYRGHLLATLGVAVVVARSLIGGDEYEVRRVGQVRSKLFIYIAL